MGAVATGFACINNEFTYSVKAMVLLPIVRKALDGVQELKIIMSFH